MAKTTANTVRRRRLTYALLAVLLAIGALTYKPPSIHVQTTPATEMAAPLGGATYYWHGYSIDICGSTPLGYCSGFQWWTVTAHVAVWANGSNVVMASHSGYPYCTASGYYINITGCSWHGGGSEIYVVIAWQNCIAPFSVGCFDDFATLGFNGAGSYNYFRENWPDAYP